MGKLVIYFNKCASCERLGVNIGEETIILPSAFCVNLATILSCIYQNEDLFLELFQNDRVNKFTNFTIGQKVNLSHHSFPNQKTPPNLTFQINYCSTFTFQSKNSIGQLQMQIFK